MISISKRKNSLTMCGTIICHCGLPMDKCIFDVGEKPEICPYCGEKITRVVHLESKKKVSQRLSQKTLSKKRKRNSLKLIKLYFQFKCQQENHRFEKTYLPMRKPTEEEKSLDTCSQCVLICYCNFPMGECFYQKYINDGFCICGKPHVINHYNLSTEERDRRGIPLSSSEKYQSGNNNIFIGYKYCCTKLDNLFEQKSLPWNFR